MAKKKYFNPSVTRHAIKKILSQDRLALNGFSPCVVGHWDCND